jgi:CBS domain-containing protein
MKVGEAMTRGVISIAPESLMTKAAHMMLKYDVSGLPVVNAKGELVGIITERATSSGAPSSASSTIEEGG